MTKLQKNIFLLSLFVSSAYASHQPNYPLHEAIRKNDINKVRQLLADKTMDVNLKDTDGNTPLTFATLRNNVEAVKILFDCSDLDVNAKNNEGVNALLILMRSPSGVDYLCAKKQDLNLFASSLNEITPQDYLYLMRIKQEIDNADSKLNKEKRKKILEEILERSDLDVNAQFNHGLTALICAIREHNTEGAKKLLERSGIDVNVNSEVGTALMQAAFYSNVEVAEKLLERSGIDVNSHIDDFTVLMCAVSQGSSENKNVNLGVAKLLLARLDTDINMKDKRGKTALSHLDNNNNRLEEYLSTVIDLVQKTQVESIDKDHCLLQQDYLNSIFEKSHHDQDNQDLKQYIDILVVNKIRSSIEKIKEEKIKEEKIKEEKIKEEKIKEEKIKEEKIKEEKIKALYQACCDAYKPKNSEKLKLSKWYDWYIDQNSDGKSDLIVHGLLRRIDCNLLEKRHTNDFLKIIAKLSFATREDTYPGFLQISKYPVNNGGELFEVSKYGVYLAEDFANNLLEVGLLFYLSSIIKKTSLGGKIAYKLDFSYGAIYPLHEAIRKNDIDKVKLLLADETTDLDKQDKNEFTPLMIAAKAGHTEIVKKLLDQGADINHRAKSDYTTLMIAVVAGHVETVKELLAQGADPNDCTEFVTCLTLIVDRDNIEMAKILLACPGIDVNLQNRQGYKRIPLIIAAEKGHTEMAKILLACPGIDVNLQNRQGHTPLIIAAEKGHTEIVKILLACSGIDVNIKDRKGRTALSYLNTHGVYGNNFPDDNTYYLVTNTQVESLDKDHCLLQPNYLNFIFEKIYHDQDNQELSQYIDILLVNKMRLSIEATQRPALYQICYGGYDPQNVKQVDKWIFDQAIKNPDYKLDLLIAGYLKKIAPLLFQRLRPDDFVNTIQKCIWHPKLYTYPGFLHAFKYIQGHFLFKVIKQEENYQAVATEHFASGLVKYRIIQNAQQVTHQPVSVIIPLLLAGIKNLQ